MDSFPLTPNGKIDRKALPAPEGTRPQLDTNYVVPRNAIEQSIVAVWQDVLGVPTVGVFDNFFDLGGHSLLLVRAQGRLQTALGRDLSILDMFRFPTVDALAKHLSAPAATASAVNAASERAERQKLAASRNRERRQIRKSTR